MRRFHFNERPDSFEIDPQHQLAQQLVFAGLGRYNGGLHYHDSSLYGNHGTLKNMDPTTDWVRDLGRWATVHNGTDQNIPMAAVDPRNSATTVSAMCWVYATDENARYIFGAYQTTTTSRAWAMMIANAAWRATGNEFGVVVSTDGSITKIKIYYVDTAIMNAWHHVGFTWNSGTLTLYLDGTPATVVKYTDSTFTTLKIATCPLCIASANPLSGSTAFFGGMVSDCLAANTVWSPDIFRAAADPSNVMYSLGGSDPGLLRYRRRWWPVSSGAAPATKYWLWARQRRSQIIGGGVT